MSADLMKAQQEFVGEIMKLFPGMSEEDAGLYMRWLLWQHDQPVKKVVEPHAFCDILSDFIINEMKARDDDFVHKMIANVIYRSACDTWFSDEDLFQHMFAPTGFSEKILTVLYAQAPEADEDEDEDEDE